MELPTLEESQYHPNMAEAFPTTSIAFQAFGLPSEILSVFRDFAHKKSAFQWIAVEVDSDSRTLTLSSNYDDGIQLIRHSLQSSNDHHTFSNIQQRLLCPFIHLILMQ